MQNILLMLIILSSNLLFRIIQQYYNPKFGLIIGGLQSIITIILINIFSELSRKIIFIAMVTAFLGSVFQEYTKSHDFPLNINAVQSLILSILFSTAVITGLFLWLSPKSL